MVLRHLCAAAGESLRRGPPVSTSERLAFFCSYRAHRKSRPKHCAVRRQFAGLVEGPGAPHHDSGKLPDVKGTVEDLAWVADDWIQTKVLDPVEINPEQLGNELRDQLVAKVPVLQEWVDLSENIRRGEIVDALCEQMTEVARIVARRARTFDQARELTPHCTMLWTRFDELDKSRKTQFSDVEGWGPRRSDLRLPRREDILDTIGEFFFARLSGAAMERSMKAFRKWHRNRNMSTPK